MFMQVVLLHMSVPAAAAAEHEVAAAPDLACMIWRPQGSLQKAVIML